MRSSRKYLPKKGLEISRVWKLSGGRKLRDLYEAKKNLGTNLFGGGGGGGGRGWIGSGPHNVILLIKKKKLA